MKIKIHILLLTCLFFFSCAQENKKSVHIENQKISSKWIGSFKFTINETDKDWRAHQEIQLKITEDSIAYSASGFQIYDLFRLSSVEKNGKLFLHFSEALENTENSTLKETKDFGFISLDNGKYIWNSPYLNTRFSERGPELYVLKKN
ncbi:hypothetical protein HHL23_11015 [Chryseobacterium sp. RP-3-3]|uniref:Lipoprotein n=1 Tax=Chryseobacterium antibioticum TaxID=2728847 RepID=A0A7Y0AN05_9FLAO|nr:hypothetical protein [Chryseobacterium antibioticum]NML70328.1 hypothetical protein [Chryseobacterium antibioticum]